MAKGDGRGGKREGAGRKKITDERESRTIMLRALKENYQKEEDEDAKVEFVKELLKSQRGQQFVAEHVFGKAKEIVHNINTEITEEDLTPDIIKLIIQEFKEQY